MKRIFQVVIKPSELGRGLRDNIKSIIREKIIGDCCPQYGYVSWVDENSIQIGDGVAQRYGGGVVFDIECDVDYIKPQKDDIIRGQISEIVSSGVFVTSGFLKILISKYALPEGALIKVNSNIDIDGKILEKGDRVDVKIIAVKYENKNFKILGEF